jgi:hypothetical protein
MASPAESYVLAVCSVHCATEDTALTNYGKERLLRPRYFSTLERRPAEGQGLPSIPARTGQTDCSRDCKTMEGGMRAAARRLHRAKPAASREQSCSARSLRCKHS